MTTLKENSEKKTAAFEAALDAAYAANDAAYAANAALDAAYDAANAALDAAYDAHDYNKIVSAYAAFIATIAT